MNRLKFNTKKQPKKFAAMRSYTHFLKHQKTIKQLVLSIINYAS